ncbi:hypothetical protein BDZ97DRAFT_865663 [Flammula alnicola]|nr:hypothetical protein BDZ97DRAFT_865663 [Flammula alnicola]
MAHQISITRSRKDQLKAAVLLSQCLHKLGCPHAYIGGFAFALLGSARPTEDIDVLIEIKNINIQTVRYQLMELSEQFASAGIKLYFVQQQVGDLKNDELVRAAKNNVLIETLQAGTLGLPVVAEPRYLIEQESGTIALLHPSILILTKMKRWYHNHESTRPKTVLKNKSDQSDIDFLLYWLAENDMKIDFEKYQGKTRDELLCYVRQYHDKFHDNTDLVKVLDSVVRPDDWELLLTT